MASFSTAREEHEFEVSYTPCEARQAQREVAKNKEALWNVIEQKGFEYTPIYHFYHVTKPHNKESILQDQCLKRRPIKLYRGSVESPLHLKIKGVFFMCNLRQGEYSDISPFGSERVKIPIEDFTRTGEFELFFNSYNFTKPHICYAVMVMVRKSDPEYDFCRDHLVQLDLESNELLRLDFDQSTFSCCQLTSSWMQLWLEVIVVGDTPIEEDYEWDRVMNVG